MSSERIVMKTLTDQCKGTESEKRGFGEGGIYIRSGKPSLTGWQKAHRKYRPWIAVRKREGGKENTSSAVKKPLIITINLQTKQNLSVRLEYIQCTDCKTRAMPSDISLYPIHLRNPGNTVKNGSCSYEKLQYCSCTLSVLPFVNVILSWEQIDLGRGP